jgi:DNA-binding NarL/FixJ family response regulator
MRVSSRNKNQTGASPGTHRRRQIRRHKEAGTSASIDQLTPRQRETLQLIAEGYSTKEIAFALGVSVKTVETHRAQLKERLGIYNVAGLVRFALRVGLISPQ